MVDPPFHAVDVISWPIRLPQATVHPKTYVERDIGGRVKEYHISFEALEETLMRFGGLPAPDAIAVVRAAIESDYLAREFAQVKICEEKVIFLDP